MRYFAQVPPSAFEQPQQTRLSLWLWPQRWWLFSSPHNTRTTLRIVCHAHLCAPAIPLWPVSRSPTLLKLLVNSALSLHIRRHAKYDTDLLNLDYYADQCPALGSSHKLPPRTAVTPLHYGTVTATLTPSQPRPPPAKPCPVSTSCLTHHTPGLSTAHCFQSLTKYIQRSGKYPILHSEPMRRLTAH